MEAPEFFHGGFCRVGNPQLTPEKRHGDLKSGEHFIVDDLLDFSNEDDEEAAIDAGAEAGRGHDAGYYATATHSTDSSTITVVDSCISSFSDSEPHLSGDVAYRSNPDGHFSSDLCVPYDELAELEWLSNFVEESFSTEDFQRLQLISGAKSSSNDCSEGTELTGTNGRNNPIFHPELSVPGKARSKRSRAAPCNWSSRLLVLSPTTSSSESDPALNFGAKSGKLVSKKKEVSTAGVGNANSEGRKCQHCATEKTPQWRTGPMGPKTLCNACGVRYKSGRLVPEYRPAASPTFSFTKHSNSHRKVLELRRHKELMLQQQQQQFLHPNAVFDIVGGGEYLIHHNGSDFPQLI